MSFITPIFKPTLLLIIIMYSSFHTTAQSILLVGSNSTVYNTYDDSKYELRKLDQETWVNYKGKNGEYIKISNFFGKDQFYPNGMFEGYVHISSILDTATRKEYENLISSASKQNINYEIDEQITPKKESILISYDVGKLYLGISKKMIEEGSDKSIALNGYDYDIQLSFNSQQVLTQILLAGKLEDALAVDGSIKDQIFKLKDMLIQKYGHPSQSISYPSFLELEDEKLTVLGLWIKDYKSIFLGIKESKDMYYPSVIFKMK